MPSHSPLITGIDHLRISVTDLDVEVANYEVLLGVAPLWRGAVDGCATAVFDGGNLYAVLTEADAGGGLSGICFAVSDTNRLQRRLQRTQADAAPAAFSDPLAQGNAPRAIFTAEPAGVRGLPLSFVEGRPHTSDGPRDRVTGLDHVVINSCDANATGFLLAGQLGLDLRMDMSRPEWGARLLFFRCGNLIVEVVQQLEIESTDSATLAEAVPQNVGSDRLFGLSWRVAHTEQAHQCLVDAGFDVSSVRKGRKPGTQVFTVRDRTAGVATLLLQPPAAG